MQVQINEKGEDNPKSIPFNLDLFGLILLAEEAMGISLNPELKLKICLKIRAY